MNGKAILGLVLIGAIAGFWWSAGGPGSSGARSKISEDFFEVVTPGEGTSLPRVIRHRKSGMRLILVEPGSYQRGSPDSEPDRQRNEFLHDVSVDRPFYLAETELTCSEWRAITGEEPPTDQGEPSASARFPVMGVSWNRARQLAEECNAETGSGWRLPTEVEWEYACRAGTTTAFSFGERIDQSLACMNGARPYPDGPKGESRDGPVEVASYDPNPWGFYDLHGNLWEWCVDLYDPHPERGEARVEKEGASRVIRGGGFPAAGKRCRSAYRDGYPPSSPGEKYGVRLVYQP